MLEPHDDIIADSDHDHVARGSRRHPVLSQALSLLPDYVARMRDSGPCERPATGEGQLGMGADVDEFI
jgi:hypothetical protein